MTLRRSHESVLADVLGALAADPTPPLTAVATRTNVPYDRLHAYVAELRGLQLLEATEPPKLTHAGFQLLAERHRWQNALHDAGLDPRQS